MKQGNNRGGFYAMAMGITMVFLGMLFYLILFMVFEGTGAGSEGLFGMAENESQLNVSGEQAYQVLKNVWVLLPLGIMLAGVVYIALSSQRVEPESYYYRYAIPLQLMR